MNMASKKYKTQGPILLNYTGETVSIKLSAGSDVRFQTPKSAGRTFIVLPPLGKPIIKTEFIKGPGDIFPTIHYHVTGLPPPGNEVFYIVSDSVAKLLSRHRNDLMILYDVTVTSNENPLKPNEICLNCTDLAHVLIEIE